MPSMPPIAVKITDEIEKRLSPQRVGKKPPIEEPTNIPIQTKDLPFISLNYTLKPESWLSGFLLRRDIIYQS